jgi:K+-sensing histidine kinase KdpD
MTTRPSPGRPWTVVGRGAANAAPRTIPDPPRRLLLASGGEPFSGDVIARAIELATPEHATITVLAIARVYGTSLGFPNPGLQPNRIEIEERKKITEDAATILRAEGFDVRVAMSKARNIPKMIARWANAKNFHAIVVPDPERPAWRRFLEGDVRREIERRCSVPVHAVPVPAPSHRTARAG